MPIAGWIIRAVVGLGTWLAALIRDDSPLPNKRAQLPWTDYVRDIDEDIVEQLLRRRYFASVQWTGIFQPGYELRPWEVGAGIQDGQEVGQVFAPIRLSNGRKVVAHGDGLGIMPGTMRGAGHLQALDVQRTMSIAAFRRLCRYYNSGAMIRWGRSITNTFEHLPATSQTGLLAWSMANQPGPDMYKVDTRPLLSSWRDYFDNFYSSVWDLYAKQPWDGEWAAPYIAIRLNNSWQIGIPGMRRPQPAPLVTPHIFQPGHGPGTPNSRDYCVWVESDTGRDRRFPDWPWQDLTGPLDRLPEHRVGGPAYTQTEGGFQAPAVVDQPTRFEEHGKTRCHVWPDGRELLAEFGRVDDKVILPALRRLRARQERALVGSALLPVAYVRLEPDSRGRPRYQAFDDLTLRNKAVEARKALLAHPARMRVNWRDAAEIDQEFADALKESGVPTNPMLRPVGGLANAPGAGAVDPGEALPPALPPEGGVPFDQSEQRYSLLWGRLP